jgi:mannose-1-phosphate guanylyltransferase
MDTVAVVLAGGTGTRLYPASRSARPKQLQAFGGDRSLLARTVERASFADETYVVTREDLVDQIRDEVPQAGILVEPVPKDTGPALTYATHRIKERHGECVCCCLHSDHLIAGDFVATAEQATRVAAETDALVTIGIEPTRPATEYGYIEPGRAHNGYEEVDQFVEKPDAQTAEQYVQDGYYWNAGMFVWTPDAYLREAAASPLEPLVTALDAGDPDAGFDEVEAISVDYAVMESATDVAVVPASFEWDDIGSWDAFERVLERDEQENVSLGETLAIDAQGNVLAGDDDTHVSVCGVDDLVVAAYDDRVLVVPKDTAQRVREVVDRLRAEGTI